MLTPTFSNYPSMNHLVIHRIACLLTLAGAGECKEPLQGWLICSLLNNKTTMRKAIMQTITRILGVTLLGALLPLQALAECAVGMSEVIIATPNGVSKNICVPESALPGIEKAQEYATVPFPSCPCIDVWTGTYDPDTTVVTGTPPVLPDNLGGANCTVGFFHIPGDVDTTFVSVETGTAYFAGGSSIDLTGMQPENSYDSCAVVALPIIIIPPDTIDNSAILDTSLRSLFPDEILVDSSINDPRLQACQTFLESRGCQFTVGQ